MLNLHNNLTRINELFCPLEDKKVKMYTCGPSTYQRPHIGNYRTFLFEDILHRYLEYSHYEVSRLMTLTNIEDKAITQSEKEGVTVEQLTSRNEAILFEDFERLRIMRPDYTVRASTIVDQAVKLIKDLIDKGIAYKYVFQGRENIYYDPLKFPGFGKLAHLNMKYWPKHKRRFHLDTYPGMPWNKGDFILWHGYKKGEKVCWETEIGRGRPAWNIQDAAMVTKYLGFEIDVACGGIDNLVRHHDYTIAVAEAVSGASFARFWMHGGHLFVNGKKMSKSKGNVLYPEDLTSKGYRKEHVRFFLIYGPYAKKSNFTWERFAQTSRILDDFKTKILVIKDAESSRSSGQAKTLVGNIKAGFEKHMDDDLDVKKAFDSLRIKVAALENLAQKRKLSTIDAEKVIADLKKVDEVLQVIF
jgi:cysteinyl-tRNA synthetase